MSTTMPLTYAVQSQAQFADLCYMHSSSKMYIHVCACRQCCHIHHQPQPPHPPIHHHKHLQARLSPRFLYTLPPVPLHQAHHHPLQPQLSHLQLCPLKLPLRLPVQLPLQLPAQLRSHLPQLHQLQCLCLHCWALQHQVAPQLLPLHHCWVQHQPLQQLQYLKVQQQQHQPLQQLQCLKLQQQQHQSHQQQPHH